MSVKEKVKSNKDVETVIEKVKTTACIDAVNLSKHFINYGLTIDKTKNSLSATCL